jgi:hypothetical protein
MSPSKQEELKRPMMQNGRIRFRGQATDPGIYLHLFFDIEH